MKFASRVKTTKRAFFEYVSSRRKKGEGMGLLLGEDRKIGEMKRAGFFSILLQSSPQIGIIFMWI